MAIGEWAFAQSPDSSWDFLQMERMIKLVIHSILTFLDQTPLASSYLSCSYLSSPWSRSASCRLALSDRFVLLSSRGWSIDRWRGFWRTHSTFATVANLAIVAILATLRVDCAKEILLLKYSWESGWVEPPGNCCCSWRPEALHTLARKQVSSPVASLQNYCVSCSYPSKLKEYFAGEMAVLGLVGKPWMISP